MEEFRPSPSGGSLLRNKSFSPVGRTVVAGHGVSPYVIQLMEVDPSCPEKPVLLVYNRYHRRKEKFWRAAEKLEVGR